MSSYKFFTKILAATVLISGSARAEVEYFDYIVVGAGAAGLSAAYQLDSLGRDFVVLEKKHRSGGIAENGHHKGFHYAKGTEYLGEPDGQLAKVIQELNIPMVEIPSPMDASFYQGKSYVGEEQIATLTLKESDQQAFQSFIELLNSVPEMSRKELFALDKITAKQWLDDNNIAPFIQQRYNIMSRGLFGANLDDISALSFIPEAAFDYVGVENVSDLMQLSTQSESWTTPTGIATITHTIARNLDDKIRYNSAVNEITTSDEGYKVSYQSAGKELALYAKKIIVATPAPVTAYIAKPVLTQEQLEILSQVEYAQYATVALFSDTPIFNQAFDLAILDGDIVTDLYDATWVERHYSPELKDKQTYIASAYLAPKGVKDKSLMKYSDKEMMEIVYKELQPITANIRDKVTGYDIARFYYAYPVMSPGYYSRLKKLKASFRDIYLAGDYMAYPTFDAAFESGYRAVNQAEKQR